MRVNRWSGERVEIQCEKPRTDQEARASDKQTESGVPQRGEGKERCSEADIDIPGYIKPQPDRNRVLAWLIAATNPDRELHEQHRGQQRTTKRVCHRAEICCKGALLKREKLPQPPACHTEQRAHARRQHDGGKRRQRREEH